MWIAAALIELAVPETGTLKARRSLANSVKDRVGRRFNVSVAEVGDPGDREGVVIGCAAVGVDPRHVRSKMEKVVHYVEGLGMSELVAEDILVARLDELSGEED